jgi:glycosyltransferase involved in cell wall biosynthesis
MRDRMKQHRAATNSAGSLMTGAITTRNRASYLALTLASLEQQVLPRHAWEVIVVDNASCDDTPDVLAEAAACARLPIVTERLSAPTALGIARNHAIMRAQGKILVFLGDDCIAHPGMLLWHLLGHYRRGGVVIGDSSRYVHTHLVTLTCYAGETAPALPAMKPQDLAWPGRTAKLTFSAGNVSCARLSGLLDTRRMRSMWSLFRWCNASAPREQVLAAGGVDAEIGDPTLADADMALALRQLGVPFCLAPRSRVLHQVHVSPVLRRRELSRQIGVCLAKHPNLTPLECGLVMRAPAGRQAW